MAKDIPTDRLADLRSAFARVSAAYLASLQQGEPASPELLRSMQAYLTSVRDTCRASWARFHPLKMAAGLVLLAGACLLCYVLSELSSAVLSVEGGVLRTPLVAGAGIAVCVGVAQLASLGYVDVPWCLAAAAASSEVLFLWRNCRHSLRSSSSSSSSHKGRVLAAAPRRSLLSAALVAVLLRCASLLSDSYVIAEGRAVTFLLCSLGLYVPLRLNWDGLLVPPPAPDTQKPPGALSAPVLPAWVVRREGAALCLSLAILIGSLYLSLGLHACREEQGAACQPSPFLSPLARIQDGRLRNMHYLLSVVALAGWAHLLHRWLRHYGNLNAVGVPAVVAARWLLPAAFILAALHWAVGSVPLEAEGQEHTPFRGLADLIRLAQVKSSSRALTINT